MDTIHQLIVALDKLDRYDVPALPPAEERLMRMGEHGQRKKAEKRAKNTHHVQCQAVKKMVRPDHRTRNHQNVRR